MKKNIIIWGMAIILVGVAIYTYKGYDRSKEATIGQGSVQSESAGSKAIDFTLKDLDGKEVSLKDLKGKNVYLNFWATWCPPCRSEMPGIEKLHQKYKDKNLVILTVDLGEDKNTVNSFMQQNNYTFKVLLDTKQSVAQNYNISSIPVSYFIDENGIIVDKIVGALSETKLESYIKKLLEKQG